MIILHCLEKRNWEKCKRNAFYGKESVDKTGYIHCSSIEHMWRVAPNFKKVKEDLVLLAIDTKKVSSEIKWEDFGNYGQEYPHIYGLLNLDSVVAVYPFLKDENDNFVLNEELEK